MFIIYSNVMTEVLGGDASQQGCPGKKHARFLVPWLLLVKREQLKPPTSPAFVSLRHCSELEPPVVSLRMLPVRVYGW